MGQIYSASIDAISVSAEQDLFEITAPNDAVVVIHEVRVAQESEEGTIQEEALAIKMVYGRGAVTAGSGGSTLTPVAAIKNSPSSSSTVKRNNTTKMSAGSGSLQTWISDSFYTTNGWKYKPCCNPSRPVISPGEKMTVELAEAPMDAITVNAYLIFEEIGG